MTKEYWDKLKVTMLEDIEKKYDSQYLSQIKDKTKVKTVTKSGREVEEILKFIREENIDIIVIGTHGRTGIQHVLVGSVAENIVRRSPIPVFIIPCKKQPDLDSAG
jgi:nucleotide-binding universal stress UspA family protein